jgi:O-antigen/teichoic acid export membrane protein
MRMAKLAPRSGPRLRSPRSRLGRVLGGRPGPGGMSVGGALVRTTVASLAVPAAAVLTGPILARELGPGGRGELAALIAPLVFATLVANFGIPEALTYTVARRRISGARATRLALLLGAGCGLLAAGSLIALSPILLRHYPHARGLFAALAAALALQMTVSGLRNVASASGRYELPIRERWFSVITRVALICGVAIAGQLTVTEAAWFTHGTAVVATVMLLPILFIVRHRRAAGEEQPTSLLLRYGAKTWVGTLSGIVILRLDQVLLAPLTGSRQLGYYAVAVAVAEVPATGLQAVRDITFAASADRDEPALVGRAARIVTLVAVPACLLGILLAPWAVPLAFGSAFHPAIAMTQILLVATIPSAMSVVMSAGLLSTGHPELASRSLIAAAVTTVIALLALVPPFGAIGAALASLIAYCVSASLIGAGLTRVTGLRLRDVLVPRRADIHELAGRLRLAVRARLRPAR